MTTRGLFQSLYPFLDTPYDIRRS
jgi:hypothetical protein